MTTDTMKTEQMADARAAMQAALAALEESHDDVVASLNQYADHPANRLRRQAIFDQIARHDAAAEGLRAALDSQAAQAQPSGETRQVIRLTADDLHWFEDALRAWENSDFAGVLNGLNVAINHFAASPSHSAAQAQPSGWIPVGKRLPDDGVEVLTYPGWGAGESHVSFDQWCESHKCFLMWIEDGGNGPTHWMPIPASPSHSKEPPSDQRQVREDNQGLGEPGRLSPLDGVEAHGVNWYERHKEECERDHGPYPEDGPLHERLAWWRPKSARFGSLTIEDDLAEAAEFVKKHSDGVRENGNG